MTRRECVTALAACVYWPWKSEPLLRPVFGTRVLPLAAFLTKHGTSDIGMAPGRSGSIILAESLKGPWFGHINFSVFQGDDGKTYVTEQYYHWELG